MFSFFKHKKDLPPFSALEAYEHRSAYFVRTAAWDWLDKETIYVVDPLQPRMLTLNPWGQWLFIAANGQMTVSEFVRYMAEKYKGDIPATLDETIINELNTLLDYGIIQLTQTKQPPDTRFELPQREQKA